MSILVLFIAVLLVPLPAFAFGPIAHTDLGLGVVAHAGVLTASIAGLIRRRQRDFLMGTLDPDRILAKNLAPYPRHTHNWDRAFRLFRQTRDEAERARLLGYVCHLAADVVAHNLFVPVKTVENWPHRVAGHAWWEMRFDARVRERTGPWALWGLRFQAPDQGRFLTRVLEPSVLGPGVNLRLTGLAMQVQRGRLFGLYARTVDHGSRIAFADEEVLEIRDLALRCTLAALEEGREGRVVRLDPRGLSAIRMARDVSRDLRARRRQAGEDDAERAVDEARRHFHGIVDAVV